MAAVAAEMFARQGWAATTISGVATQAGVSPELVSTAFGGKPGLLMAAFRHIALGHGGTLPQAFAMLHLEREPDPGRRLDRFVEFVCDTCERMAPLLSVLALGADQDAELRAMGAAAELRHAETARAALRVLGGDPVPEDAADSVYALTRAEVYLALVQHRGWTPERYRAWLRRVLVEALERPELS